MAEGIIAEVQDGFAHIQFVDRSLRGPALARLLELGGPELIDIDTRSGSRKIYIVPESMAREAKLLDGDEPSEPDYPEGEPKETWTVSQLRAYAKHENIDLGEAVKKADILAAVSAPKQESPAVITPPAPVAD